MAHFPRLSLLEDLLGKVGNAKHSYVKTNAGNIEYKIYITFLRQSKRHRRHFKSICLQAPGYIPKAGGGRRPA